MEMSPAEQLLDKELKFYPSLMGVADRRQLVELFERRCSTAHSTVISSMG
jgi:hypothetical protein